MKKFFSYLSVLIFVLFLCTSMDAFAQCPDGSAPPCGGPGGGPGPCRTPPCNPPNPPGLVPIDSGIVLLLTSGLIYGIRELRKNS